MRSGELRHPIVIQTVTETQSASGELSESWGTFANVWADMQPLSSRETFQANQEIAHRTVRFYIRYLAGLTHKMRISYDSRIFDIETIINTRGRDRTIEIIAIEVSA